MILLRCYPKITDFVFHFFNQAPAADYRFLPVYSYGFFVACGFLAASLLIVREMKRRESLGLLKGNEAEITVGEAPKLAELIFYFLFAFVVFFKLLGIIAYQPELSKGVLYLKDYFFSPGYGSWIGGIIGAVAVSYYYYYTKNKAKLPEPIKTKVTIYPSDGIGDLVVIAAVLGILGSALFNFLETADDFGKFWQDPVGFLTSGLSVYGGLICAGFGFAVYVWRKKYHFGHFFDSIAPGYMMANGVGRIGCQVSGDGDWGIVNIHPKPEWFPQFLWADNYAHHIVGCDFENNVDVIIPGCNEDTCCQLAQAVYPTPIYEFIMCAVVFLILWSIGKKLTYKPGMVFTIFMILIGIQRYTIEQWRDLEGRELHSYFGIQLRQSEEISIVLFSIGIATTLYLWKKYKGF